jgi:hypothetical protein
MGIEDDQVDRNYEAFRELLPRLLETKADRFALMHNEEVVGFFESSVAAVTDGMKRFGAGNYSVQQVATQAENLGFYSYAGGAVQA